MERVEPSNIHAFTQPLGNVPPKREETPRADKRVDTKSPMKPDADTPHVEVTPVYVSEDSGAIVSWGSFLFILFWLGGIGAYVVGLFGWDRLVQLQVPSEWYGLIAAALVVPVILVIFIALLAREMRVLRRQSVQLAHAAAELTEPEDHAARSLTKLGRAIRRELDLFNASIESASARMSTLEVADERAPRADRAHRASPRKNASTAPPASSAPSAKSSRSSRTRSTKRCSRPPTR